MSKLITGIPASPGLRIGKVYVHKGKDLEVPCYTITEDDIPQEIIRLEEALAKTKSDIKAIQDQLDKNISKDLADIFLSHLMVLEDPLITQKVINNLKEKKNNVEWIIHQISEELISSIQSIDDEYLRERIIDVSDIYKRLINHLQKKETGNKLTLLKDEIILFAKDLTPSDTATLNKNKVLAFVTDTGGKTSHTAIMARALAIPAIVGTVNGTSRVNDGDIVIIDAIHGQVILEPSKEDIETFIQNQNNLLKLDKELSKLNTLPAVTVDNEYIVINGNIEDPAEKEILSNHGADGIGLYRTEFLFLDKELPDEETQLANYKEVVEYFNPKPVVIRTIDVGGDKIYSLSKSTKESNPFLGCRAIRFSLANEKLFRIQLRAILRSSNYGKVKLMFPMISTVEELLKAKSITEEVKEELRREGILFDEKIEIGIMIEVPSAAIISDLLALHCDFFSVGTNDLIQYTIAVDRINDNIAYLYNPFNPSIIRTLKLIADNSRKYNIPLSICGEMAGDPRYTILLLGLGYRNFSMSTVFMYQIKQIIRSISITECEEFVDKILEMDLTDDINDEMQKLMEEKFPGLIF